MDEELDRDPTPPIGQATPAHGPDDVDVDDPAAPTLWLPDPEAPRGWRTYQVRPRSPRRRARPLGFLRGRRPR